MRLTPLEQIRALQSALTTGAAEYRTHAAHQRDKNNLDGVRFATVRATFLVAVYAYLEDIAQGAAALNEQDPVWTLPSDHLQELADAAAANLHTTLAYDATKPGDAQIAIPPPKGGEQ